jgi:hypothetical protein
MKKKILITAIVGLIITAGVGFYLYNMPAKTAANQDVFEVKSAAQLYLDFSSKEAESTTKYLDKNLEVFGTIQDLDRDSTGRVKNINFSTGSDDGGIVSVSFTADQNILQKEGDSLRIRGLCRGYLAGDLLGGEVQLSQAVSVQ